LGFSSYKVVHKAANKVVKYDWSRAEKSAIAYFAAGARTILVESQYYTLSQNRSIILTSIIKG
jgi:hypothetical protein